MATRKQVLAMFDRHAPFLIGREHVIHDIRSMIESLPKSDDVVKQVYLNSMKWGLSPVQREGIALIAKGKSPIDEKVPKKERV